MKAIYKCRFCGKEFPTFSTGEAMATKIMIAFELDDHELLRRLNINAYPRCTHNCGLGNWGIADFIGFKMEDEDTKEINE